MSEKPSDEENAEEGYFSFEGGLEHDGDEPQPVSYTHLTLPTTPYV